MARPTIARRTDGTPPIVLTTIVANDLRCSSVRSGFGVKSTTWAITCGPWVHQVSGRSCRRAQAGGLAAAGPERAQVGDQADAQAGDQVIDRGGGRRVGDATTANPRSRVVGLREAELLGIGQTAGGHSVVGPEGAPIQAEACRATRPSAATGRGRPQGGACGYRGSSGRPAAVLRLRMAGLMTDLPPLDVLAVCRMAAGPAEAATTRSAACLATQSSVATSRPSLRRSVRHAAADRPDRHVGENWEAVAGKHPAGADGPSRPHRRGDHRLVASLVGLPVVEGGCLGRHRRRGARDGRAAETQVAADGHRAPEAVVPLPRVAGPVLRQVGRPRRARGPVPAGS
jgi:hypothetical protein